MGAEVALVGWDGALPVVALGPDVGGILHVRGVGGVGDERVACVRLMLAGTW